MLPGRQPRRSACIGQGCLPRPRSGCVAWGQLPVLRCSGRSGFAVRIARAFTVVAYGGDVCTIATGADTVAIRAVSCGNELEDSRLG